MSPPCQVGHRYCSSRDITFLVCHVIKQGHVIKGSGDYINRCCLSTSTLCHHPAKFGGHRHCSRGDIMVLVCLVISQDHIIRGSCYFQVGAHQGYHSAKFLGHRHSVNGVIMVFFCHMTFQYHLITVLNDVMIRSPLRYVSILPSLVAIDTVVLKI